MVITRLNILAKHRFPGYGTVQTIRFSTHQNRNLLTTFSGQAEKFSWVAGRGVT